MKLPEYLYIGSLVSLTLAVGFFLVYIFNYKNMDGGYRNFLLTGFGLFGVISIGLRIAYYIQTREKAAGYESPCECCRTSGMRCYPGTCGCRNDGSCGCNE